MDPVPSHDPGGRSKPLWPAGSAVEAFFSPCGQYRLWLRETWDPSLPAVMFLLMNPSVAGIGHSDPTLRKTGRFARAWGYGSQWIGNVHAYRATDNKRLMTVDDPVGPGNDEALLEMARASDLTVLAYGKPPKPLQARAVRVVSMLREGGARLTYLRLCKDGTPEHPLYLRGDSKPMDYPLAA